MKTAEQWIVKIATDIKYKSFTDRIEEIQNEAYNQCLKDLSNNDLLPDKK